MTERICNRDGCEEAVPKGRRAWCSGECREIARRLAEVDIPDFDDLDLIKEAQKAYRERDAAVRNRSHLTQAVRGAVEDAMSSLRIPPVPAPKKDNRKHAGETAIVALADWQLAKTTPTYNSSICEERIEALADKVVELTEIQRADHPVRECRVYLLGDLVEGELIFPGQAHRIDASLYRQVVVDGPRILSNFLRKMSANFDKVHVVGVCGNHGSLGGRARKEYHPESNADMMMYEVARLITGDGERITWDPNINPGERKWYAVDYVGQKGFLLFHGDQMKGGFAGWPWYSFGKGISGWAMGAIPEPFHYSLSGHFHNPVRFKVGRITHWGVGSTESTNTWAAEELKAQGTPSQLLLFSHPERGVTNEYEVHLD